MGERVPRALHFHPPSQDLSECRLPWISQERAGITDYLKIRRQGAKETATVWEGVHSGELVAGGEVGMGLAFSL